MTTSAKNQVTKAKPAQHKLTQPRKNAQVDVAETVEETWRNHATVITSPEFAAYRVINGAEYNTPIGEDIDVPALVAQLKKQSGAVNRGDLSHAEAMLMNQATALQSLFARLAERGMSHAHIPGFEANMRMALRAQSQCRSTLETLATIKNPPVIFAKQANIANGHQQINNGTATSHAQEIEINQNELLEAQHGNYVDSTATSATIGSDPAMATVGEINRSQVTRR